jgi:hypothetical protein
VETKTKKQKEKENGAKMGGECCTYGERRNICRVSVVRPEGMTNWKTKA